MSGEDKLSDFELRTRAVLAQSLTRIDARTRSRLNRARHAALEQVAKPRRVWLKLSVLPTGAVAAAVLVALLVVNRGPHQLLPPPGEGAPQTLEVLDLVADDEALSLMEDEDHSFYEWAAAQSDAGPDGGAGTSS
jgi:hypothetical protein